MKIKLKLLAACLLLTGIIHVNRAQAQNLLDMSGWTIGEGSSGIFAKNGLPAENIREWGAGPFGDRVILWKSQPSGDDNGDGGWKTSAIPVVSTNMYRFTVWIKKTNSIEGKTYFGCNNVTNLDGTADDNPYFWSGDLPVLDRWYLLVGYIHSSEDPSLISYGGLYDGVTGEKVLNFTDFKFVSGATTVIHRSFLYSDTNLNDRQYSYAPRIDLINGNEPPIAALLGKQQTSSGQSYFADNVGIKTTNPGAYELAVNGKIRTKEIKVETANWPDFVFDEAYKTMPLPELKQFIEANKHLPEIPPAKEMEANGVNLGEMNRSLLKKVEELTLHLIGQDEKIEKQDQQIKELMKALSDLRNKQ